MKLHRHKQQHNDSKATWNNTAIQTTSRSHNCPDDGHLTLLEVGSCLHHFAQGKKSTLNKIVQMLRTYIDVMPAHLLLNDDELCG
jgi:hypothetical protein